MQITADGDVNNLEKKSTGNGKRSLGSRVLAYSHVLQSKVFIKYSFTHFYTIYTYRLW